MPYAGVDRAFHQDPQSPAGFGGRFLRRWRAAAMELPLRTAFRSRRCNECSGTNSRVGPIVRASGSRRRSGDGLGGKALEACEGPDVDPCQQGGPVAAVPPALSARPLTVAFARHAELGRSRFSQPPGGRNALASAAGWGRKPRRCLSPRHFQNNSAEGQMPIGQAAPRHPCIAAAGYGVGVQARPSVEYGVTLEPLGAAELLRQPAGGRIGQVTCPPPARAAVG
jgi:hypothetical protein